MSRRGELEGKIEPALGRGDPDECLVLLDELLSLGWTPQLHHLRIAAEHTHWDVLSIVLSCRVHWPQDDLDAAMHAVGSSCHADDKLSAKGCRSLLMQYGANFHLSTVGSVEVHRDPDAV